MKERKVLNLRRENGRSITAEASGHQVAVIVWRKNTGVLLPLVIDSDEAEELARMLTAAVKEAGK
jgi:bifunctional DNase/RNase